MTFGYVYSKQYLDKTRYGRLEQCTACEKSSVQFAYTGLGFKLPLCWEHYLEHRRRNPKHPGENPNGEDNLQENIRGKVS